jgi:hypothetical protein
VPWSRIFNGKEVLLAINTDYDQPRTAWVTVDNELHWAGGVEVPLLNRCGADWSVGDSGSAEWEGGIDYCSIGGFCDF